jgi:ribosomal protein L11 methyltransferase
LITSAQGISMQNNNQLWLIETILPANAKDSFMDGLEEFADSMACFEHEGSEEIWKLQIYTQEMPDQDELETCITMLAAANDIGTPSYTLTEVEQVDWVAESQKNFKSVEAGRFFIYPSWRRDEVPAGFEGIEIDPQRAFGTGGHETTKGCMLAMQKLSEKHSFNNMLDMGCGSGILAITMAKIWPQGKIIAVDYDQVCVDTTIVNAEINQVSTHLDIAKSDGYASYIVQNNAPYDLIASNILAAPLIEFAPMAAKALAKNGYLILAGLLVRQANDVLATHEKEGLSLVDRQDIGDWSILVLRK